MFIVFAVAYGGISCSQPTTSELGSEREDHDHDDNPDNRHASTCSDRDSCQDICDDLFSNTTERYDCYDLTASAVNTIADVSDELEHNEVNSSKLEDIDADDLRAYLEIGMESFIDLVKGEAVGDSAKEDRQPQWNPDNETPDSGMNKNQIKPNAEKIMKWIAEQKDIAEVILEQDRNFELGLELFQAIHNPGIEITGTGLGSSIEITGSCANDNIKNPVLPLTLCDGAITELSRLSFNNFNGDVSEFLSGFLSENFDSDKNSFMTFSADERNETAFEWGHNTLLEFCKEATDENENDVEVKTCLQTTYCIHRAVENNNNDASVTGEGIFDELEDYEDIVGRTDADRCDDLDVEDRMEDLFD